MAAAVLPIILGISAAATGLEAYSAFNKPSAPKAPTQTQTTTQQAEAAQAAAQAQATALMRRRGMAATMLTTPMGVTGSTPTLRATLGT